LNSRTIKVFLICLLFFSFSSSLQAEEKSSPIKITSDRLISDNKSQIITFIGNVKVVREDLEMTADAMDILQEKSDDGKSGIDMIVARGNVKINKKGKYATAEKAIYYEALQKIILSGSPRSWEDKNEISGEEMTFFMNEDRLVVKQGKKKQVNVIFYPEKKQ